jgi:hypothetical protein
MTNFPGGVTGDHVVLHVMKEHVQDPVFALLYLVIPQ